MEYRVNRKSKNIWPINLIPLFSNVKSFFRLFLIASSINNEQ
jgi:hypothetical protein